MSDYHQQSQNPSTSHQPPPPSPDESQRVIMTPPRSYPSPGTSNRYVAPLHDFQSDTGSDKGDEQDCITLDSTEEVEVKYDKNGPSGNAEVLYVNVRHNEKLKARRPTSTQNGKYAKDIAYFMHDEIHSKGYAHSLIWLVGAEGPAQPVGVLKFFLAHYSPLLREQIRESDRCDCVIIPHYTRDIIILLMELLHNGQIQPLHRDYVNLLWDLMKDLGIDFNMNSFYYHDIEEHAQRIKPDPEEGVKTQETSEDAKTQETSEGAKTQEISGGAGTKEISDDAKPQPKPPLDPEVNKVTSTWIHEEIPNNAARKDLKKATEFFGSYQKDYTYDPKNPEKRVVVHNVVLEARRIRQLYPALALVRADQIEAERKSEDKRILEEILAEEDDVITLSDDDDDNAESMKPLSSFPPLITDEAFKVYVRNNQLPVELVKEAAQTKDKIICLPVPKVELCEAEPTAVVSDSVQFEALAPNTNNSEDIKVEAESPPNFIPPNFNNRTGIAVIPHNSNSSSHVRKGTESTASQTQMPHLEPAIVEPKKVNPEEHKENPIMDLPRLVMFGVRKEAVNLPSPASNSPSHPVAAAVVPKSKVNIAGNQYRQIIKKENNLRFIDDGQQPCSSGSIQMSRSDDPHGRTCLPSDATPKKKIKLIKEEKTDQRGVQEKYRENLLQQQQHQNVLRTIVVASRMKEVPGDVKVDRYIEDRGAQFYFQRQADNWNAVSSPQLSPMLEQMEIDTEMGNSGEIPVDENGGDRGRGRGRPKGSRGRGRAGSGRGRSNETEGRILRGSSKSGDGNNKM